MQKLDWKNHVAAIWRAKQGILKPVRRMDPIELDQLLGVDQQKLQLVENTQKFLRGEPANHTLLWGARGTGKSSLIKGLLNRFGDDGLRCVEVGLEDLEDLPEIVDLLDSGDARNYRFILFCDDFSFEKGDGRYKALKTILAGSLELPPENVLLYATSNRRHLIPENASDNQQTKIVNGELHHGDVVEETLSLADRFGLWLSFYPADWDSYLKMVDQYFNEFDGDREQLHTAARQFAMLRASHSGRTAEQFSRSYIA
ncbi:ATP-binding protein [uncultured Microbulbifer sp.]|uniref:ATP-binding protein n=1 Tax=uncultured Microbulbifer sp. TaxID=348147 RepID=UPI00261E3CE2|nr:ATP-binding protein [uncultured Microbulbifer sp.]